MDSLTTREAFAQTDIGRELTQNLELYRKYSESPMHPEVIAYWEKEGPEEGTI